MNLFNKLFGKKEPEFTPDNSVLLQLIQAYHQNETPENYKKVIEELYGPRAFLVVPTDGEQSKSDEWKTLEKGTSVAFTTVFDVQGMLVFGVFISETTLSKWTDMETAFMAMPARAVLDLAETHSFGRIVIDSDQETMFVLERNRENISTTTIQEETQVQVGFPQNPIDGANKSQLLAAFSKNSNIKEVYHFVMLRNQESIYILAIVLENYSENARLAVMDCVSDGMKGFALDLPLESMYIEESDSWYETVQNFGVFYGGRSEK